MHKNEVNLTGILAYDPMLVKAGNKSKALFKVRIDQQGQNGTTYQTFVQCEAWETTADIIGGYSKGHLISVKGSIKWNKPYINKNGDEVPASLCVNVYRVEEPAPEPLPPVNATELVMTHVPEVVDEETPF